MSTLTFKSFPKANGAAAGAGASTDDRPKAEVWLNVGINVDMPNAETGELEPVFVNLPVGIPLDTMQAITIRGKNAEWHQLAQAKNWLLDELQKMSAEMEPGEDHIVEGLQIQVRRVSGEVESVPSDGTNPLLAAMSGRLSAA